MGRFQIFYRIPLKTIQRMIQIHLRVLSHLTVGVYQSLTFHQEMGLNAVELKATLYLKTLI